MNKKKKYEVIGIVLLIILITFLLFFNKKTTTKVEIEQKPIPQELSEIKPDIKTQIKSILVKEGPTNENTKNVSLTLNVFDKSYPIKTEEGINVYDAMKSIEDKSFSFKATENPSLGYFVEEINGVKSTPGKYWIYYVNGKEASVGISKYILKNGDIISWKQE